MNPCRKTCSGKSKTISDTSSSTEIEADTKLSSLKKRSLYSSELKSANMEDGRGSFGSTDTAPCKDKNETIALIDHDAKESVDFTAQANPSIAQACPSTAQPGPDAAQASSNTDEAGQISRCANYRRLWCSNVRSVRIKVGESSDDDLCISDFVEASPYVDEVEATENDGHMAQGVPNAAQAGPTGMTITNTVPVTYGLERFEKNAMIIFAQSGERGPQVRERIDLLKSRFGDFRFEAEVYVDQTKEEMENTLEEFFSRDFAAVGAVAVVALAPTGEAGLLAARAQRYHESSLLRWLTADQPSSLRGKPKIYITEANRTGVTAETGFYTLPVDKYRDLDMVGVHIPVVIDGESHPLKILCELLGSADSFPDEVTTAAKDAEVTFPALQDRPIQVIDTLQMKLRLEKKAE